MAVTSARKRILTNLTRAPYFFPDVVIAAGAMVRVRFFNWTETINLVCSGDAVIGVVQAGVAAGFGSNMVAAELFSRNWQVSELFILNPGGTSVTLSGDVTLSEMSTMFPAHAMTEANGFDGTESNAGITVV